MTKLHKRNITFEQEKKQCNEDWDDYMSQINAQNIDREKIAFLMQRMFWDKKRPDC